MNSTFPGLRANGQMSAIAGCEVYSAVLKLYGGPELDCAIQPLPGLPPQSVRTRVGVRSATTVPAALPYVSAACGVAQHKVMADPLVRAASTKVAADAVALSTAVAKNPECLAAIDRSQEALRRKLGGLGP
jgi:hypothetical protein